MVHYPVDVLVCHRISLLSQYFTISDLLYSPSSTATYTLVYKAGSQGHCSCNLRSLIQLWPIALSNVLFYDILRYITYVHILLFFCLRWQLCKFYFWCGVLSSAISYIVPGVRCFLLLKLEKSEPVIKTFQAHWQKWLKAGGNIIIDRSFK